MAIMGTPLDGTALAPWGEMSTSIANKHAPGADLWDARCTGFFVFGLSASILVGACLLLAQISPMLGVITFVGWLGAMTVGIVLSI
jgi:hypothetical protein